jgi:hypothetical protein
MLLDTARRRKGHGGRGVYGDGAMTASGEEGEGERRGGVALGLVPGVEGEFLSPPDAPWVAAVDRRGGEAGVRARQRTTARGEEQ